MKEKIYLISFRTPFCVPIGIPQSCSNWLHMLSLSTTFWFLCTLHFRLEHCIFRFCTFCMLSLTITLHILSLSITLWPMHQSLYLSFENCTSCSLVLSFTLLFSRMGFALYKMRFWSFILQCSSFALFVSLNPQAFLLLLCFVLFCFYFAIPSSSMYLHDLWIPKTK